MARLARFAAAATETMREFRSAGRPGILFAVSLGWMLSIGVRFVYPALIPFVRSEFSIGLTTTGFLLSLLWAAYALGHIPGGVLGDRIGEGSILVVSTVLSAGTVLLVASSRSVLALFLGTIAFGLATALYGPNRLTLLTDVYGSWANSAIGLVMAAGSVGNAAFPVLAAAIASYATWRMGFGVFVPAFLGVAIAIWLLVPGRTSTAESSVDGLSVATLKRIASGITTGQIPVVVSIQLTLSFVIQGFASFYPAYLTANKGYGPGAAATVFGVFFAVGAVVQVLSGVVTRRLGARRTLQAFVAASVLALWLLPFAYGDVSVIALTLLLSSLNGSIVVTQTYIAEVLPADMQGTGLGVLKAGWMVLGATSPLFIGAAADAGYFNESLFILAAAGTCGLALSVFTLSISDR